VGRNREEQEKPNISFSTIKKVTTTSRTEGHKNLKN
jgi:hypothetical protein